MERRLVKAYDRMTMPDECSRRIEQKLERELKSGKKENGRWTMELVPAPRQNRWAMAASIVCLVLVLSAGGTILFLNATDNVAARMPEQAASQPPVTETTAQTTGETDTTVEYAKDGLSFRYPAEWHLEVGDGREQFYNGQRLIFWIVRKEAWEMNLELDTEGYQAMLRRDRYTDTVVTEVSRVSVGGMDANRVIFTDWDGIIAQYDVAAEDAGYSFCFIYFDQNGQTDTQAEEALMASVRFGAESKSFVLSDRGKEFLQKMCHYMPDWAGYASLDESFWKDFLFLSFTSPEWIEDGKAMTICGETEYTYHQRDGMDTAEGQVKISREAVDAYVKLAMGCEMPEFAPGYEEMEPGQTALYCKDGYYYIGSSDFGSVGYTFRDCEVHEETYDTSAFVTFDVFVDEQENVIGTVAFQIYPAENENGFTIISKTYTSVEGPDREEADIVTTFFAGAYFSGDTEAMRQYLADSYSGAVAGYGGGDGAEITGKTGLPAPGEEKQVGAEETVSIQFKESPTADSYTYLTMELVKQEDGWKVKFYGLEK